MDTFSQIPEIKLLDKAFNSALSRYITKLSNKVVHLRTSDKESLIKTLFKEEMYETPRTKAIYDREFRKVKFIVTHVGKFQLDFPMYYATHPSILNLISVIQSYDIMAMTANAPKETPNKPYTYKVADRIDVKPQSSFKSEMQKEIDAIAAVALQQDTESPVQDPNVPTFGTELFTKLTLDERALLSEHAFDHIDRIKF